MSVDCFGRCSHEAGDPFVPRGQKADFYKRLLAFLEGPNLGLGCHKNICRLWHSDYTASCPQCFTMESEQEFATCACEVRQMWTLAHL